MRNLDCLRRGQERSHSEGPTWERSGNGPWSLFNRQRTNSYSQRTHPRSFFEAVENTDLIPSWRKAYRLWEERRTTEPLLKQSVGVMGMSGLFLRKRTRQLRVVAPFRAKSRERRHTR